MIARRALAFALAVLSSCASSDEQTRSVVDGTREVVVSCELRLGFERFEVDGVQAPSTDLGFDVQELRSNQQVAFRDVVNKPLGEPFCLSRTWLRANRNTEWRRSRGGIAVDGGNCSGAFPLVGTSIDVCCSEDGRWTLDPTSARATMARGGDANSLAWGDPWIQLLPPTDQEPCVEEYEVPSPALMWLLRPCGRIPFRDGPEDCVEVWGALDGDFQSHVRARLMERSPNGARYSIRGNVRGAVRHAKPTGRSQIDELEVELDGSLEVRKGTCSSTELRLGGTARSRILNVEPRRNGAAEGDTIELSIHSVGEMVIAASIRGGSTR